MKAEGDDGTPVPSPVSRRGEAPPLAWRWLGRLSFGEALALQEDLRRRVLDGETAETLLLVEHPATITLGRSAREDDVTAPLELLRAREVEVVRTSRGGDVTYHGPGQLVAYPVVRLSAGVLFHVSALASAVSALLAEEGVAGRWDRAHPGVWVSGPSAPAKIAAVGVNVHRRVAIHGLAFNVSTDLSAFQWIVPCGQPGARVTSLERETGRRFRLDELAPRLALHLATSLRRALGAHL